MGKTSCSRDRVISNPMDHLGIPLRPPMRNLWRTTIGKYKRDYFQRGTIGDLLTLNMGENQVGRVSTHNKVSNNIMN
jgi:hypothetical protein